MEISRDCDNSHQENDSRQVNFTEINRQHEKQMAQAAIGLYTLPGDYWRNCIAGQTYLIT
jgi:hypothetical protein